MAIPNDPNTIIISQTDPGLVSDSGNTTYQSNGTTYVTRVENFNNTFVTTNQIDSPSGPNGALQYNSSGNLNGSSSLVFNTNTSVLNVPSLVIAGRAQFNYANSLIIGGGANGQALVTDGNGNIRWGNAGGSGGVAGSNTQIQFNDSDNLGASPFLTFDKNTNTLTALNANIEQLNVSQEATAANVVAGSVRIGNTAAAIQNSNTFAVTANTTSASSNITLFSTPASGVSSIEYVITATDSTYNRKVSRLSSVTLGGVTNFTEYSSIWTTSNFVQFNIDQSAGTISLKASPSTANLITYSIMLTVYN